MRLVVAAVLACVIVLARPASAAMMEHYDLAGLVLESDAVVVADRTPAAGGLSTFRVTRVVRGAIQVGAELVLDDTLYAIGAADAEVIVFLTRAPDGGAWRITSSGLRVREGGRVFRFEQWSNPGGFARVPQGDDPSDQWRDGAAAIDAPTFERELAVAIQRADGLAAALAIADPTRRRTATLALLAPPGASRPGIGFYADELAVRAAAGLAAAGDLEGALDARARDRSAIGRFSTLAPVPALLALAADASQPAERRATALAALRHSGDLFGDAAAVRAVIALVDDDAPPVRVAAVAAAANVWDWGGGTGAQAVTNRGLARQVARALARRFAIETDGDVLYALAAAHDRRRLPARRGGPAIATRVTIARDAVQVDVRCLRRATLRAPALTSDAPVGGTVVLTCGADQRGSSGGLAQAWTRGAHPLRLAITVDRHPIVVRLGTLTADGAGELFLSAP